MAEPHSTEIAAEPHSTEIVAEPHSLSLNPLDVREASSSFWTWASLFTVYKGREKQTNKFILSYFSEFVNTFVGKKLVTLYNFYVLNKK